MFSVIWYYRTSLFSWPNVRRPTFVNGVLILGGSNVQVLVPLKYVVLQADRMLAFVPVELSIKTLIFIHQTADSELADYSRNSRQKEPNG